MTTRKHIDRNTQGRTSCDLHAFACAFFGGYGLGMQSLGDARLDRSEPIKTPGKGSA